MESLSEPLLLSSVYLAVLSIGLPPTQGRRRKKMGGILPKTAKLQSPEKFSVWRKHSISQKQTAALQCLHGQLGSVKGSKPAEDIRSIWTSFRCQFESGFNYRLCVLAAIFSLFQRGWQCFDSHSSMSLLSHLSDTPRWDQRSEIWVLSALCWDPCPAWLSHPSHLLCGLPFPSVALPYLSPVRVPAWNSLLACSNIYVWVPQHSDLPTQLLLLQPSSVLTVTGFPLQKSLSLVEKKNLSIKRQASQLNSRLCWIWREICQWHEHQEIMLFLYLCVNSLLLPISPARQSCQFPHR